jgi:hypothetical protein
MEQHTFKQWRFIVKGGIAKSGELACATNNERTQKARSSEVPRLLEGFSLPAVSTW